MIDAVNGKGDEFYGVQRDNLARIVEPSSARPQPPRVQSKYTTIGTLAGAVVPATIAVKVTGSARLRPKIATALAVWLTAIQ